MKFNIAILCIHVLAFCSVQGTKLKVNYNVTDKEYDSIPRVFELDNFESCGGYEQDSLYCYAEIQLLPTNPKNTSKHWQIIEELQSSRRTYRHDLLRHGICIPKSCPDIPRSAYATGNSTHQLKRGLAKYYTSKYATLGLKAEINNIKCQNQNSQLEIDYLDALFLLMTLALFTMILIGTVYDIFRRIMELESNGTSFNKILMAFSIVNNWERLTRVTPTQDSEAMAPLEAIRVINLYLVILTHTFMIRAAGPVLNTKYVEDLSLNPFNMFFLNGGASNQFSFALSGWMLSYGVCVLFEKKSMSIKHIFLGIFNRYLRLAPMLIYVTLFCATWMRHIGNGPMWHKLVIEETQNCRNNGIWNVLFLNNYINSPQMCMPQTWYIACDTQLFFLGLFVMKFVLDNPQYAKKTFATLIVLGIVITFVEHYYKEYEIVMYFYPEVLYNINETNEQYHNIYTPGHHQISCYVQGLACGYYFYKLRRENKSINISKLSYIFWLIIIFSGPIGSILVGYFFYQDGFECSRFIASLYHSTLRYLFGAPISMLLFALTFGFGGPVLSFTTWKPFRVLGRLSLSVYLWHSVHIRMYAGFDRLPNYISHLILFRSSLGDFALSYAIGFVVCLCVEMPASALQKLAMTNTSKEDAVKKTE